jgi:hypothetical protein
MTESSDHGMTDEQRAHLTSLREAAAAAQTMADSNVEIGKNLDGMMGTPLDGPIAKLRAENERSRRYIQQVASVNAAQAAAYEAMIAAGGPDNSRAYVEYEAACQRNLALLPQDDLSQHSLDHAELDELFRNIQITHNDPPEVNDHQDPGEHTP